MAQKVQKNSIAKQTNEKQFLAAISNKQLMWFLGILAFLLFINTLQFGFVLDDEAVISKNSIVQKGISGIPEIFTTFYWEGYWSLNAGIYRPLSLVLFAIEWSISPNNPMIHHLVQIVLYALTTMLLFKVLLRLFDNQHRLLVFLICLLFVLHPSHTEVVANIKSRDELLCLFFILLTFNLLLKERIHTFKQKLIIALLFFLALLSKEGGIVFIGIAFFAFIFLKKMMIKDAFVKSLPLIIITIVWLLIHQTVISSNDNPRINYSYHDNSLLASDSKFTQKAAALALVAKYGQNSVYPFTLSYDYSFNQIQLEHFPSTKSILGLFIVLFSLLFPFFYYKKHPELAFGLVWFAISLSLICNLFFVIGTTYGDRLLFVPSIGILICFVFGIQFLASKITGKNSFTYVIGCTLVLSGLYSFRTINRTKDWESNEKLFSVDVTSSPNSARVHYNYGILKLYSSNDSLQGATNSISPFLKCIEIDSNENLAYQSLGVAYFRIGEFKKSIEYSVISLKQNPTDTAVNGNIADAYFELKDYTKAIEYYKEYVIHSSSRPGHFERFGMCYFQLKKYEAAISVYELGLKKFPDFTNLSINIGNCYGAKGDYIKAVEVFNNALSKNPGNKQIIQLLVLCYQSLGDQENVVKYTNYLN